MKRNRHLDTYKQLLSHVTISKKKFNNLHQHLDKLPLQLCIFISILSRFYGACRSPDALAANSPDVDKRVNRVQHKIALFPRQSQTNGNYSKLTTFGRLI